MKNITILSIILLLLTFGCLGGDQSSGYDYSDGSFPSYDMQEAAPAAPSYLPSTSSSSKSYITKEGSIKLKVPDGTLETKYEELKASLMAEGATFSDINYYEYSDRKQYTITMKVLPSKFDSINNMLKEAGELKDMSVQLEDVTQQYTDTETRIKNKEIELDRLRALYNQSGEITDLLEVEHELSRVETELELLKQNKIYLDSKIQKSTIYLTIYEDKPATQQLIIPFEGFASLFFGALAVAIGLIVAGTGFLLPIVIVLLVLWTIYKKIRGKKVQSSKAR
ncbi:MAG: DUF4349 domain-containing protein [Candidatus Micrarchaeota archaeon]